MLVLGGLLIVVYQVIESTARNQNESRCRGRRAIPHPKNRMGHERRDRSVRAASTDSFNYKVGSPAAQNPLLFTLSGQNLTLQRGTGSAIPLNSGSVSITSVVFTDIPAVQNTPEAVKRPSRLKTRLYPVVRHKSISAKIA